MSTDTEVEHSGDPVVAHATHDVEHEHPSDLMYLKVGAVLFVLTAIEVATYALGMKGAGLVITLMPLMVVKFGIVAAYFMHLKFDSKLFRRFFVTGIVLAIAVYMIVLSTLHFF